MSIFHWHCTPKQNMPHSVKPICITTWDQNNEVSQVAFDSLISGRNALDAVEYGARFIEDTQNCCVGLGGNPDRDGKVTLDASIMDHQFNMGAVAGLERIQHPITVARQVMTETPHVMLIGEGAQSFALAQGHALMDEKLSLDAEKNYMEWLKKNEYRPQINIEKKQSSNPHDPDNHDTMGILALDSDGRLSGACTTSGMAFKMRGRVGDSPIIGAGLYVNGQVGAAVATGQGEELWRSAASFSVVNYMSSGSSPQEACKKTIQDIININPEKAKSFQAALIALDVNGRHGGYAVHPGFTYGISTQEGHRVIVADSHFKE